MWHRIRRTVILSISGGAAQTYGHVMAIYRKRSVKSYGGSGLHIQNESRYDIVPIRFCDCKVCGLVQQGGSGCDVVCSEAFPILNSAESISVTLPSNCTASLLNEESYNADDTCGQRRVIYGDIHVYRHIAVAGAVMNRIASRYSVSVSYSVRSSVTDAGYRSGVGFGQIRLTPATRWTESSD